MIYVAAIEIGVLVMVIVAFVVAIYRARRKYPENGEIMKPRCENCLHHAVNPHTKDSPMVICTQEGINVHRWYKCDSWETEDGQCQTCEHSKEITDDPDCEFVWCEKKAGRAVSKYDSQDCWEQKKV